MSLVEYEVQLGAAARAELADLHAYIAERSSSRVADKFIGRIEAACHGLSVAPHRGTQRSAWGLGLRSFGVGRRASIVFRVNDEKLIVTIVGVLYGGREIAMAMKAR